MIRKSVKRFSGKIMLCSMQSISFTHPGRFSPDGS